MSYHIGLLRQFSALCGIAIKKGDVSVATEKPVTQEMMQHVASGIVKLRFLIIGLFLAAAVYCILSMGKVRVSSDLTAFLPEDTETRQGLVIMQEEFTTYASANVMVSNITYDTALRIAEQLEKVLHVTGVTFDDSTEHYKNASALFNISFDAVETDPDVVSAMKQIRSDLSDYDFYVSTSIGSSYSEQLAGEMLGVMLLAVAVIVTVLVFTSRSYFEVVIFFIVFLFAAILNMGTNYWLGEISSITNTIAVIMQLALAIDYAIIFMHRYQDEAALTPANERGALVNALSKAIIEISSSSLTTVAGLLALTLMQFKLGYDLGMVLAKGILCSLITVFFLMPGLIMLFRTPLRRTLHKNLIPSIRAWGKLLMQSKYCFVWLILLIAPFAYYWSNHTDWAFSDSKVNELRYSERRATMHKITDTFDDATPVAVLVPQGHYEYEKAILAEFEALPEIKSATGLSNIKIDGSHVLTDPFTAQMFSELLDIDIERSAMLFLAYGVEHKEYQAIFQSVDNYEIPLIDLFLFTFDLADHGVIDLSGAMGDSALTLRGELNRGVDQLRGDHWDRLVLTATVPIEGEASVELTETLRAIAERYYGENSVVLVGDITSTHDLAESYNSDMLKINLLTIAFVFVILLFTFRTVAGAALLVLVIQTSIWINFSFAYLWNMHPLFVTNMIVSAIQMGATIDYAIVLMNHYQTLKASHPPKEAMIEAVNESFATLLTSGSIMTMAGLLISFRISDVYIGHIGLAVGRGALISIILVLTVLPQLIVLLDKLIDKTRFTVKLGEEADA